MQKINIERWINGCKVRACDWVDGRSIYVNIQYVKPGGRVDDPAWEKTALIEANEGGIFMVENMLESVADRISKMDIPNGGKARIEFTVPSDLKKLWGINVNETTV